MSIAFGCRESVATMCSLALIMLMYCIKTKVKIGKKVRIFKIEGEGQLFPGSCN